VTERPALSTRRVYPGDAPTMAADLRGSPGPRRWPRVGVRRPAAARRAENRRNSL